MSGGPQEMEKFAPGSLSLFGMLPQVMYVLADAWTSHFYRQRHYSIFKLGPNHLPTSLKAPFDFISFASDIISHHSNIISLFYFQFRIGTYIETF